jgi:hypothetical protein
MQWVNIILDFLRVLLSAQMITALVIIIFLKFYNDEVKALFKRLTKLPGGVELSAPQQESLSTEKTIDDKTSPEPQSSIESVPIQSQDDKQIETLTALYTTERSRAYFWEYSYLNLYLVARTQQVLDWIAALTTPLSIDLFDSMWMPFIPEISERKAIISALERHYLIAIESRLISITPKGHEYIEWRTKVLNPPKKT